MSVFRLSAPLVLLGVIVTSGPAGAEEPPGLLDVLRENGTITREQYEALREETRGPGTQPPAGVRDNDIVQVSTEGGLEVQSSDGRFSFELGGRLMLDAAFYDEDKTSLGSGTELRRARVELEGTLLAEWSYEFEVDFAGGDADIKDASIEYRGFRVARLRLGQFKEPFSLEEQTSSKYLTFMERALPNELVPGRSIGAGMYTRGETWTTAAGLFGEAFDDDPDDEGDEGWGLTGRLTLAPLQGKRLAVHLGAAASYRVPDDANEVRFDARPESHVTGVKYVNTGKMPHVAHVLSVGAEAATVLGPLSLQAEYIGARLERDAGADDVAFQGWYAYASWFPTGESRNYKFEKGGFGGIEPMGDRGALELALRYSTLDLTDGTVPGGEEDNITLGLTWYVNSRLRFMTNYILVNADTDANDAGDVTGDDEPRIFQVRCQVHF